jgi:hypothetical protein
MQKNGKKDELLQHEVVARAIDSLAKAAMATNWLSLALPVQFAARPTGHAS